MRQAAYHPDGLGFEASMDALQTGSCSNEERLPGFHGDGCRLLWDTVHEERPGRPIHKRSISTQAEDPALRPPADHLGAPVADGSCRCPTTEQGWGLLIHLQHPPPRQHRAAAYMAVKTTTSTSPRTTPAHLRL